MDYFKPIIDGYTRNLEMFKNTVADFSEADFFVRPCPGANHAAWQIGQVISAENWMVGKFNPPTSVKLPEGFDKKFTNETASNDDPSFFPKKDELMDLLSKTRANTIAWVKTLKPEDLAKPSPEKLAHFLPTLGDMIMMIPGHLTMHMGQIQVIRRKLGKPLIF